MRLAYQPVISGEVAREPIQPSPSVSKIKSPKIPKLPRVWDDFIGLICSLYTREQGKYFDRLPSVALFFFFVSLSHV